MRSERSTDTCLSHTVHVFNNILQHADVHVNKILIGNKCDIDNEREVSTEEGAQLAAEYGIQFFETSAKNDINVEKG
jgi:Ras-related protein Rab-8A